MERLWAGWRSAYVGGLDGRPPTGEGSLFERILRSGLPDDETYVVWRGEQCSALLNAYPYTSGHLMVLPNRAIAELDDLSEAEADELWAATRRAVRAVRAAYRPEGVNVGLNLGLAAGAGVPDHLHVHVLPRWSGDTNFTTAVAEARVLPEPLGVSWERLVAAWPG
ncbi:MAG: HIT domain-containing protein [Acidimicrobiia bacterium]|nr:HIT domain-containing protein [Acidimicrobiia bacterium]